MNVVLSIEAVRPPLAGIGRYVWELATRLPHHQEVESLRFISDGLWRTLPDLSLSSSPVSSVRQGMDWRHVLGKNPLVSRVYGAVMPKLAAIQINRLNDTVFHGPNFFVPNVGIPTVVTIHDLSAYYPSNWHPQMRIERMQTLIPHAVNRASLVLTDSEATRLELLQEFNLSEDKVQAIPLGVDQVYHPRPLSELEDVLAQYGLQAQGYSLFVSTIEPRKNLSNLIAAYSKLPSAMRQRWPLVLVGGKGWNSEEIHAQIEQATAQSWLKYLGYVPQAHLPLLYAGARLFTYPSLYEGFGLPIAEAMASGVPVLTSNCSSMPEVAGTAALLVEPRDVDQMCVELERGLSDNVWRTLAIPKGLERASQLTWDTCVDKTLLAYKMAKSLAEK
ncbi:glycosyltransferase family 4 protein [Undibacterium sp. LX40W]|uniref:Glycosyltransferase family 4 protein n=1 Tax=Undibacterium nitidum TaxID=2762298 RepID=A0A923HR34_9BURK|nr:glycosyltransferase family 1 protein [Undibacterium nitidum]MBC3881735.1 glycosyltransferase family 4 protein [Undibacterium nitidum]MBC3892268.1 glycosyltransferase family 4 protein [Undibacterium sp. LX40W]